MSYDLAIRNDENHSQFADPETLNSFLIQIPHIVKVDGRHFEYNNGKRCLKIYLDYVDKEGDTCLHEFENMTLLDENEEKIRGKVNLISISLPYGFDSNEILDLWDICFSISACLEWRVFDCQTGEYIENY